MGLFVDLMERERAVGIWRLKVRLRELVLEKTRGEGMRMISSLTNLLVRLFCFLVVLGKISRVFLG
jgi:hypothetical protein